MSQDNIHKFSLLIEVLNHNRDLLKSLDTKVGALSVFITTIYFLFTDKISAFLLSDPATNSINFWGFYNRAAFISLVLVFPIIILLIIFLIIFPEFTLNEFRSVNEKKLFHLFSGEIFGKFKSPDFQATLNYLDSADEAQIFEELIAEILKISFIRAKKEELLRYIIVLTFALFVILFLLNSVYITLY